MKLRTFIFLRITPIFFALAAANAGALYWAESKEIEANLAEEVEAASVILSEYFAAKPELAERLRSASGRSALTLAMAQSPGLKSVAVFGPSGSCCLVQAGRLPEAKVAAITGQPLQTQVSGLLQRHSGEAFVRSTIRLPRGEVLAIEIDADRTLAQQSALLRHSIFILVVGGSAGLSVSLLIAAWLTADIRSLRQLITGRAIGAQQARFVETQDVADAIAMLWCNLDTTADLKKIRLTGGRA